MANDKTADTAPKKSDDKKQVTQDVAQPEITAADIAKKLKAEVRVPGKKKGTAIERKATAADILDFRVSDEGKAATALSN